MHKGFLATCHSGLSEEGGNLACAAAHGNAYNSDCPQKLIFQWHITERCNLRCSHCYQDSYAGPELGFEQWLDVIAQLEALLKTWHATGGGHPHAHINVTGGEPFLHPDFLRLLELFAAKRDRLSFAILCNGHFVDAPMASALAEFSPGFVQVSLDGLAATHDRIRGRGSFDRNIAAIKHLTRTRVPVLISFTAHRSNYREFPAVAQLACDLRVKCIWSDRFIPAVADAGSEIQSLWPAEAREFIGLMQQAREATQRRWFCHTEVAQHRALQFLTGHDQPYRCTAGGSLLTLLPNGDLLPCRRLPIRVGNVMATPLHELYEEHPVLRALRDPHPVVKGCEPCAFRHTCHGGLRCLAYAVNGDPFTGDPGCWLLTPTESNSQVVRSA